MKSSRRDPLASTRRDMRARHYAHQRETMTDDVLRAKMMRIIRDHLETDEPVSLEHFRQANLPMERVPGMFKGALAAVQNAMATERE